MYTGYVRVAVCNGIIRSRAPAELVLVWAPCTCNSPRGSRSTCCQQRRSYWERMDRCIVLTVKRLWGRRHAGDTSVFTTIRPPTSGRQTTSASVSAMIRTKSLSNSARIIFLSLTLICGTGCINGCFCVMVLSYVHQVSFCCLVFVKHPVLHSVPFMYCQDVSSFGNTPVKMCHLSAGGFGSTLELAM